MTVSKSNNKQILNLIKILNKLKEDKKSERKIVEIIKDWSEEHQLNVARVKTVLPLTEFEIKEIQDNLNKVFNQEIMVINEIDKSILAGIKIIYGSKIIDNSMSHFLNKLKFSQN